MRQATVGGDSITGIVFRHGRPLRSHRATLYSGGKAARIATTDENGKFALYKVLPGTYLLNVQGWGSTPIRVSLKADRDFPQKPNWYVSLLDNGCVGVGFSLD
jgi:hypothetical protein